MNTDEPVNEHDARCPIWLSDDPADTCNCHPTPDPVTRRQQLEDEWRTLPLPERVRRLDTITHH